MLTNVAVKTFHLGNQVHGAYSGQGIPKNMHEILINAANENLDFETTYSMEDVCTFVRDVLLSLPSKIADDSRFNLVCVVAGHDRGSRNQKLRARHFTLSSKNNYQPDEGPGVLTVGAGIPEMQLDILEEESNKNVKASNRANKKLIELIAKTNVQVGGKIISVTVRNNDT